MRKLTVLAGLSAMLAMPASALASTRYADPAGSGVACTQGSPCTLSTAIGSSADSDEVIVNPGTYSQGASISAGGENLNIHGATGAARPVINSSTTAGMAMMYLNQGTVVNHLALNQTASGGLLISSALIVAGLTLNDLDVALEQPSTGFLLMGSSTVTNMTLDAAAGSVAVSSTANSVTQIRNATIIAAGGSTAISATANGSSTSINVAASIVRSGVGGVDFSAQDSGDPGEESIIHVDFTNSTGQNATSGNGAVIYQSGNQSGTPAFVDAPSGDFRMQPNSPTIDAGAMDGFSTSTDADGKPRPIGPASDMGAYEYGSAPTISTGSGSADSATTATVAGSINTNDSNSTYHFDYGTTTGYGSATSEGSLSASLLGANAVSTGLHGLEPNQTYHYRLVSTNQLGTTVGADATFVTPAAADPGTGPAAYAGAIIASQTLKPRKRSRKLKLRVRCPADTIGSCKGIVSIAVKKRKKKLNLKAVRIDIAKNTTKLVTLKLSKKQYRILRKAKRMTGRATSKTVDGAGRSKTTTGKIVLKK